MKFVSTVSICVLEAIVCGSLAGACSGGEYERDGELFAGRENVLGVANKALELPPQAGGKSGEEVIVDPKGRSWRRSATPAKIASAEEEQAHFDAINSQKEDLENHPADFDGPSSAPFFDVEQMSVLELAQALRGRILVGGVEYLEEPGLARAAKLKNGLVLGEHEPFAGAVPGEADEPSIDEELVGQSVIGFDNRTLLRNNTSYPNRTIISLGRTSDLADCTATLIGPSTAITAAHCFRTDSGAWTTVKYWGFSPDSQDSVVVPWDPTSSTLDNYPHSTGRAVEGCMYVAIPGSYSGDNDADNDYAVIEFDRSYVQFSSMVCNEPSGSVYDDHPGDTLGWLGFGPQSDSTILNTVMTGTGTPGVNSHCSGGCQKPSLWGASSLAKNVSTRRVEYDIDTTGGHSGQGMYLNKANGRYVIAPHKGSFVYCTQSLFGICVNYALRNRGSRITNSVYSNIIAWSTL